MCKILYPKKANSVSLSEKLTDPTVQQANRNKHCESEHHYGNAKAFRCPRRGKDNSKEEREQLIN